MKHVILVQMFNGKIDKVQYLESKFDRECGDDMIYDGERFKVGIVGDSKDDVIEAINKIIKKQNSVIRKKQYQENKKADKIFNRIMVQAWNDINKY